DFEPFMAQKSHYIMHLARYLNRMSPTDSADEPEFLTVRRAICSGSCFPAGLISDLRICSELNFVGSDKPNGAGFKGHMAVLDA
ncbi:hypothetical protein, partial [Nitrosomonas halophila]